MDILVFLLGTPSHKSPSFATRLWNREKNYPAIYVEREFNFLVTLVIISDKTKNLPSPCPLNHLKSWDHSTHETLQIFHTLSNSVNIRNGVQLVEKSVAWYTQESSPGYDQAGPVDTPVQIIYYGGALQL